MLQPFTGRTLSIGLPPVLQVVCTPGCPLPYHTPPAARSIVKRSPTGLDHGRTPCGTFLYPSLVIDKDIVVHSSHLKLIRLIQSRRGSAVALFSPRSLSVRLLRASVEADLNSNGLTYELRPSQSYYRYHRLVALSQAAYASSSPNITATKRPKAKYSRRLLYFSSFVIRLFYQVFCPGERDLENDADSTYSCNVSDLGSIAVTIAQTFEYMMFSRKRANATPIPLPPKPVVLSPSGTFDGDDGKWSTFVVNIAGDGEGKGQNFKVLMSTSSPITLVPAKMDWCSTDECAKRRGVMDVGALGLDTTDTAAYSTAGLYALPFNKDSMYWWSRGLLLPSSNGTLNGAWGSTNVGLGAASRQSITIQHQYVATYYFNDFFMGSLGLCAGAVSLNGASGPAFLSGLAAVTTKVPSSSYGFTAGASYRNGGNGVTGNMVFGGYDRSRLVTEQVVIITMPNKQNNTLIVGVNSILYQPDPNVQQGVTSLTNPKNGGFSAIIDSTLPYLVLPDDICDRFVEKFNLGFDKNTGLYTINSTAHDLNKQQNATVRFKISSRPQDSEQHTTIAFPYDAFYLQASDPIYTNTTYYFPIRKSTNGFYILGRTFLQEAYIIVDFERANFTVAPAVFANPMPSENLVTIYNTTYIPLSQAPKSGNGGLSGGAIAGVVIGIVAVFLILGGGAWIFFKRRRVANAKTMNQEGKPSGIDTIVSCDEVKHRRVSELTDSEPPSSPQTKILGYYGGDHKSIPELSPESHPAELYSTPLDGSSEPDYFAAAPKPRRRGATRDSSGQVTPGTPVAELSGDDAVNSMQRPKHSRGPSDNSLSTNIDEVLAGQDKDTRQVRRKHSNKFVEHTGEGDGHSRAEMVVSPLENTRIDEPEPTVDSTVERRPSHTRGLSDTTIQSVQSDSTAVSHPTPDELERWARSGDGAPK